MVRWAYAVPGATSTAFTPVPTRTAAVYSYKGSVVGQPGTQAVPVALPDFGTAGLQANGARIRGGTSGSDTQPLVWYPQLWYQASLRAPGQAPGWAGGVSIYSDNQMPVPAADPLGRAAVLARPPVFLGQNAIPQPPAGSPSPSWWARLAQRTGLVGAFGGYGG